jgi:predicted GNAT family N-acyltransferase
MSGYLKFIKYGSNEYQQAVELRHRLFYFEHNISLKAIANSQEEQDLHLVITTAEENQVLAYGRLAQKSFNEFQIYQMVVEPTYQKQGLGKRILETLIKAARDRGGKFLSLNARVTKTKFYQKFGFEPVGEVFASSMTGVPHIRMQRAI